LENGKESQKLSVLGWTSPTLPRHLNYSDTVMIDGEV